MPVAPDRLYLDSPRLGVSLARTAAVYATLLAREECPKLTGRGAANIMPIYGHGYFGLHFLDYIWIQNTGAPGFTMRSLAGKVIPMWLDDPTGKLQQENPKAKTRVTASGRTQVLIFRKAANFGEKKIVKRNIGGIEVTKTVPKHYPGAPGRIAMREAPAPWTTPGRLGGQIAKGNIGVWWYFPGLKPRNFLNYAIETAARYYGIMGSMRIGYNFIDEAQEDAVYETEAEAQAQAKRGA